jgi:hypothetical protein
MTKVNEENETTTSESTEEPTTNKFLLSDESFELLRSAQREIREATELMPSLRKMINKIVNPEAVRQLTQRFIEELK